MRGIRYSLSLRVLSLVLQAGGEISLEYATVYSVEIGMPEIMITNIILTKTGLIQFGRD